VLEVGSVGGGRDAAEVESSLLGGALDDRLHVADLDCQLFLFAEGVKGDNHEGH